MPNALSPPQFLFASEAGLIELRKRINDGFDGAVGIEIFIQYGGAGDVLVVAIQNEQVAAELVNRNMERVLEHPARGSETSSHCGGRAGALTQSFEGVGASEAATAQGAKLQRFSRKYSKQYVTDPSSERGQAGIAGRASERFDEQI